MLSTLNFQPKLVFNFKQLSMKKFNFICFLLVISSPIFSQKNTILIGRLNKSEYQNSTYLEYDYRISKRNQLCLSISNTDNKKQARPNGYVSGRVTTYNGALNTDYFFTQPSAFAINLGLKQKLNNHQFLDLYIAPEFSIVHTGKHTSYKKEKTLISINESSSGGGGFGLLFGILFGLFGPSGPSYTIDEKVSLATVPDTYHYYLNCKTGMTINYHHFIMDINVGLGRKLDSNLKFKLLNNDTTNGFQLNNISFYSGFNLGYQF